MGRHPECKVHRDDMHVSLQHFAIVGDHVAGWHLECLTPDGCVVVRERTIKMGRPRKLKHGDAIVVMVYKKSGEEDRKPLVGYRFEVGAIPPPSVQRLPGVLDRRPAPQASRALQHLHAQAVQARRSGIGCHERCLREVCLREFPQDRGCCLC